MDCFILLPVKIICRALVLSAPIIAIGVFVASVVADAPRSLALNVISAIAAVFLSLAYIIFFNTDMMVKKAPSTSQSEQTFENLYRTLKLLMRPSAINIALMHSAAIVLLVTLGIRLDATDNFGGYPANLDFGLKGYGDGDNVAFTKSSSTVGHFVQGVLASFLSYPAVAGLIARVFGAKSRNGVSGSMPSFVFRRPRLNLLLLCDLASACMTIYPFYSLVKRFVRDSTDFARTSHMNNTTEWVLGYVVGVSLGWLVTVWLMRTFLRNAGLSKTLENENYDSKIRRVASALSVSESDVLGNVQYGFGVASEYKEVIPSKFYGIVSVISSILLVLLSMTSFLTGMFIGLTWNYQEEDLAQKVNKDVTVSFALLWVIVTFFMTWFASKKWPFNFDYDYDQDFDSSIFAMPSRCFYSLLECLGFLNVISVAWACHIHGTDSGVCSVRYLPSTYMNETVNEKKAREIAKSQWANGTDGPCMQGEGEHCMPFCGKYIAAYYPVCVPKTQAFDGDHNFPRGRFKYHTVQSKDRWVERTVASMIEQRIALETNKTARQLGVDEHGKPGKTRVRFHKNRDCQEAYKRYFCYLNFPRCDDFEQSLPLCQSVCQNFFRACGMEEDLWRCNEIVDNQITVSEKAQDHFFPGAPFKKNEYNRRNMPTDICTPSIKGASTLSRPYSFLLRFISLCSTLVLVFLS